MAARKSLVVAQGRIAALTLGTGLIDLAWALLFVVAFVKTPSDWPLGGR